MILWVIATILGMYGSYLLRKLIKRRNRLYDFYLTRCDMNKTIMIMAHHFEYKGGFYKFYDGWGRILFQTDYGWNNVYRGFRWK